MPIKRVDSYLDVYRSKAQAKDIHEMSGRASDKPQTQFVASYILNKLRNLKATGLLLDIGCGDGTLLISAQASKLFSSCIGVLPTSLETKRLVDHLHNHTDLSQPIPILTGLVTSIPLQTASVDTLVCNGVLIYMQTYAELEDAVHELSRVCAPGAIVYIGELPVIDESKDQQYGQSVSRWLVWTFKNYGYKLFLHRLWLVLLAMFTSKEMVIRPNKLMYQQVDKFEALLESAGFIDIDSFRHEIHCESSNTKYSASRYNYIAWKR